MDKDDKYKSLDDVKILKEKELGITDEDKLQINNLNFSDKNVFLQNKLDEIKKQIEQLQKKQEEDKKKIKNNDTDINGIDEELPNIREQIDNKRKELDKKGIKLNDHDNAYVKEYDILLSQQDNKKEIRNNLQEDNKNTRSSMSEDKDNIKELEKQSELLEKMRSQNNKERVDEAKSEAKDKVYDTSVSTQPNAILTLMETIFAAAEKNRMIKKAEEKAEKEVNKQIDKEDYQVNKKSSEQKDPNFEDDNKKEDTKEEEVKSKDAVVLLAHTSDGKDIIRIMDKKDFAEYSKNNESVDLSQKLDNEADLSDDKKLTSVVVLSHPDKEELLKKLEPVAGNAVKFPQDLHEYCSTDDKKNNVTDVIFSNCKVEDVKGANHFSQYLDSKSNDVSLKDKMQQVINTVLPHKEEKGEDESKEESSKVSVEDNKEEKKDVTVDNAENNNQENTTSISEQNAEQIDKAEIKSETKTSVEAKDVTLENQPQENLQEKEQSSGWNLFDYLKQKLHLSKENMREDDVKKLEAGEPTGAYKLENGQIARLRPTRDPITHDMSVMVEFYHKKPNYEGIQKSLNLSDADVKNLKQFGRLNHTVEYDGGKKGLLYLDKDTNNFFIANPKDFKIHKKLKEQLDVEQIKHLKEGKPVHVENIKDQKGQKYTGWIMMDPQKKKVEPLKKEPAFFVDKEYQIQVKNNNDGARAESVKYDKDPVLKSKQQHDDDGPNGEPKKKVYKDYSQDETSITETKTTKTQHKIG